MRDEAKNGPYDVGYKTPPKHSQFKKGQSGNRKGRPKGTLNLATVLERTLREHVLVDENGRRKTITKLEAAIAQLVDKAMAGDAHAMRYLCHLVISAEQRSVVAEPVLELSATDQKVMSNILKRLQQSPEGGNDAIDPK
jgi:hypothetical protein